MLDESSSLTIGLAQISPVLLNKAQTIEKIKSTINEAAARQCELVVFGEGLLPGYPFWLSLMNASTFESEEQKDIHAHYISQSVNLENGDLIEICALAKKEKLAVYLGIIERAKDRGRHSLYCSLVYINQVGEIKSVHRKLQPTYEERLSWAHGDGNGLQVHPLKAFTVGGLNCWENWMPLPRTALYSMGENLHIAVWPGSYTNTKDITRFIAKESRSYVVSVSSLCSQNDIPTSFPHREIMLKNTKELIANGGSCIAGPNGEWVLEPVIEKEGLLVHKIDFNEILKERQNFDPSGHYSRPDVTRLIVDRKRQSIIEFVDE